MERWGSKGVAPEPGRPRRYADQPSFSSTLLDAIYKSMDEPNGDDNGAAEEPCQTKTKKRDESLHYGSHYYYKASLAGSYRASSRVTSSSSDCSSYGGFSSSEAESSQHRRLRPIRTSLASSASAAVAPSSAPEKKGAKKAKEKPGAAIRAKLRDLRGKPASPGARLAGFLNSIFAGGNKHHHQRTPPPSSRGAAAAAESACSTASSSYSRSCLSKTPSTRGHQPRRTVRFLDADVVEATPASSEQRRSRVQVGVVHLEQMLLRRMEMESDDDDDDDDEESSDASSDLFELENLAAIAPAAAGGSAAAYRDELPVYETTRVVLNRGIGHGYAHGRTTTTTTRVV